MVFKAPPEPIADNQPGIVIVRASFTQPCSALASSLGLDPTVCTAANSGAPVEAGSSKLKNVDTGKFPYIHASIKCTGQLSCDDDAASQKVTNEPMEWSWRVSAKSDKKGEDIVKVTFYGCPTEPACTDTVLESIPNVDVKIRFEDTGAHARETALKIATWVKELLVVLGAIGAIIGGWYLKLRGGKGSSTGGPPAH